MTGRRLRAPITGIVATADDRGYWLVGKDGGVFAFGDAAFAGSLGAGSLSSAVVGIDATHGDGSPPGPRPKWTRAGRRWLFCRCYGPACRNIT